MASHKSWYHTMDVAPGVATPGWFDTRPVVDLMPWPDVRGKRCLNIGTFDGFFTFQLERRGVADVVAISIGGRILNEWPDMSFETPPADADPGRA